LEAGTVMTSTRFVLCVLVLAALAGTVSGGAGELPRRPNVLVIVADDLGFSDVGCYGGEIATPNLDRLARNGLRYTQFYNTARCWPSRAAILTGYYPQQVRMDPPGKALPRWTRVLPQYLKPAGYRSYHSGKWHLLAAPKPLTNAGFDRSYKLDDQDRFFSPRQHQEDEVPMPAVAPESGYYAATAIADHAVRTLREHSERHAGTPFFHYLAFTSPHFPLQAPAADVARYRDRYLAGWDAVRLERLKRLKEKGIERGALSAPERDLSPRGLKPELLAEIGAGEVDRALAWRELREEQKRLQATKMAIHAAMVDRLDQEIGRVVNQLRSMGAYEDTAIFFVSDNGASSELLNRGDRHDPTAAPGSAGSYLCLGPGWATAANTPFRRHKIWVHEGGISTPLIAHWPKGIRARGALRRTPGHLIDLLPTVLEITGAQATPTWNGLPAPKLPGQSLVPTFDRDSTTPRELYFHHEGNRALRSGDWKLVSSREGGGRWELYDLRTDRAESHDLAAKHADRVRELAAHWQTREEEYRKQAGPEADVGGAGSRRCLRGSGVTPHASPPCPARRR